MANTYTSPHFDWNEIDWTIVLWLVLAAAAITIVAYAFTVPGIPIDHAPAVIEEWVP